MRNTAIAIALLLVSSLPALAQQSASYKLEEHALNAGGRPEDGAVMVSTSFHITLDSVGDGISGRGLANSSFHMDAGFANAYPPPGEVGDLWFTDDVTLMWNPEKSVGDYNLYRDLLSTLPGLGFGSCAQQNLTDETTTDPDPVPVGGGFFYLVTAENRLGEEGTKGFRSNGAEREGTICP